MARFVLVAGAWHGAWCWQFVVAALVALGHDVEAVELPGMGEDRTPLRNVDMGIWVKTVADRVVASTEPVVLVGHSRGGALVSEVAELVPADIELAVYVAALLLVDGETPLEVNALWPSNSESLVFTQTDDGLALYPGEEIMDRAYRKSTPEQRAHAMARVTPEPIFALTTRVSLSSSRYGRVPRAYIECLADEVVNLELQRAMQRRQPAQFVRSIDTDHSPTYSAPELLAATLDELVAAAKFNGVARASLLEGE